MKDWGRSTVVIDLDGTLTRDDKSVAYEAKAVNEGVREAVRAARACGYDVVVHSARNMRSFAGNLDKIQAHTRPLAEAWLERNGIPYDELVLGKPWCGSEGYYVDDRNLHPEEFEFRFSEALATRSVDVVVSFYNEGPNVEAAHQANAKLRRLFQIRRFIYVDNGSTDDTGARLRSLAASDPAIQLVSVTLNRGYGGGYKTGIAHATADLLLTNHADSQFDAYAFFYVHAAQLARAVAQGQSIFPRRVNRPWLDALGTALLRGVLSWRLTRRVGEFNGQPKLLARSRIQAGLEQAPDDFTFDLWLYMQFAPDETAAFEVLQRGRLHGRSSWNTNWQAKARLFRAYLRTARRLRRSTRADPAEAAPRSAADPT
jgi:capsule biosynthesis phosphatase